MARGWPSIKMKQLLLIPRRNPFLDLRFQWSWAWFEVEVKCIGGLTSGSPSLGECLHVLYSCKSPIWFIWICHLTPEMITHLEYCSDRTSGLHNSGPIQLPRPSDINEGVPLITALALAVSTCHQRDISWLCENYQKGLLSLSCGSCHQVSKAFGFWSFYSIRCFQFSVESPIRGHQTLLAVTLEDSWRRDFFLKCMPVTYGYSKLTTST